MPLSKYANVKNKPLRTSELYLGEGAKKINNIHYISVIQAGPDASSTAPVIYNVATTDATATIVPAVATLSNLVYWRLSEQGGNDFYYAYDAAFTTFSTAFGMIERYSSIPAIYVKRIGATDINLQLETWQA